MNIEKKNMAVSFTCIEYAYFIERFDPKTSVYICFSKIEGKRKIFSWFWFPRIIFDLIPNNFMLVWLGLISIETGIYNLLYLGLWLCNLSICNIKCTSFGLYCWIVLLCSIISFWALLLIKGAILSFLWWGICLIWR